MRYPAFQHCPLIKIWRHIGVAVLFLIWLNIFPALANEKEVLERGKELYQQHCSVCHGHDGKGHGVMAKYLKMVRPADLTTLNKKYGKPFPLWRMFQIIDGREEVLGHGPRDMPIWGNRFRNVEDLDKDAVRGRIWQLIYYLDSIQEEGR